MKKNGSINSGYLLVLVVLLLVILWSYYMFNGTPTAKEIKKYNSQEQQLCELSSDLYNFEFWKVEEFKCYLSEDNMNWVDLADVQN